MIDIDGIDVIKKEGYYIFFINNFSEQVKELIRKKLCMICNGKSAAENQKEFNNYKNTLIQLNKRIKDKNDTSLKIGMIGELLVHAVFSHYLPEYQSLSPFFNLEENNIKKGFDLVLINNNKIWINEVKSGNIGLNETQDTTITNLINRSKLDLKARLNNGNLTLWLNAINHARIALDRYNDEKDIVENILNDIYVNTQNDYLQGKNMNVFLTGVLFHDIDNKFLETTVKSKQEKIQEESLFNNVIIIALQKSLCDTVIDFLNKEAE